VPPEIPATMSRIVRDFIILAVAALVGRFFILHDHMISPVRAWVLRIALALSGLGLGVGALAWRMRSRSTSRATSDVIQTEDRSP
jgi:hypothetical protein